MADADMTTGETRSLGETGPGDAPDDYEVTELVTASGGQGHLFRAVLRGTRHGAALDGAEVALKQYRSDAVGVDRFEELSSIVGARRHPHFVRLVETFRGPAPHPPAAEGAGEAGPEERGPDDPDGEPDEQDADLYYVSSVWVPGVPLDEAVATGDVTLAEILTWIRQVGEALDFLHADVHDDGAVVHRDVKPANIIVTPGGGAVLIDPGIARVAAAGATGTPWGSPGYLPPETVDLSDGGTAGGPASDRWQLAATLVAALLGEPPGTRFDRAALRGRLVDRLSAEVADPGAVADAVLTMLVDDPADRPATAGTWSADLAAAAGSRGVAGASGASGGWRRWVAAVAVAALVLVAGVVLWPTGDGGGEAEQPDGPPRRVTAVIDNRVTDGMEMREDTPAYLSSVAENFCRNNGCDVPDTELVSGDELILTCQTVGQRTTNGNDQATDDDANPGLHESRVWYYALVEDGGEGFIADSWLAAEFRGGLDLPRC